MNRISIIRHLVIYLGIILFSACSGGSFEDQIRNDIKTKMPSGICDKIPAGSDISNIVVGEIVDIGLEGMTDVSIEFDFTHAGKTEHHSSAMLYIKSGSNYKLASLGGNCDFKMQ